MTEGNDVNCEIERGSAMYPTFLTKRLGILLASALVTMPQVTLADTNTTSDAAIPEQEPLSENRTVEFVGFLDLLPAAVELDQSVAIADLNYRASLESAKAARSGWYPKADITLNTAEQYDVKPGGSNAGATSPGMTGVNGSGSSNQRYNPSEAKLKITQKLWDFGETSADVKPSKLTAEMSRLSLHGAKNQTILKAM